MGKDDFGTRGPMTVKRLRQILTFLPSDAYVMGEEYVLYSNRPSTHTISIPALGANDKRTIKVKVVCFGGSWEPSFH